MTPPAQSDSREARHPVQWNRDVWALAAAVGGPIAVAAALVPGRGHLDTADNALFLVVVIVAVASTGRRAAASLAAIVSALSFDYLLTVPYGSLRITRSADLVTGALLLVVGLAVGELAARGRAHRDAATESRDEMALLHSIGELGASGRESREVIGAAAEELNKLLSLRECHFVRRDSGKLGAQIAPTGHVSVGSVDWSTEDLGLPTGHVDLPVRGNGWVLGHFVLTPTPGKPVSTQKLLVAVAIADQVGVALLSDRRTPATRR